VGCLLISPTEAIIRVLTCTFGREARDRYREEWLADATLSSGVGIARLSVLVGAARFALFSCAPLLGADLAVNTRRNVRRTLAYGVGSAVFLTGASILFLPALVLATLGFLGVVVAAAVIMARGTSRWGYVWAAAVSGVICVAATTAYWTLWTTAFNFADSNMTVPNAIQLGSNTALIAGVFAFVALIGTALAIQVRSVNLLKHEATYQP
jgi:hypothetical protein